MIYAIVAVSHRSSTDVFTYSLQPDQVLDIKKGSLIEVPFGPRSIEGVVIDFKKTTGVQQKIKIKSIKRVLSRGPIVTNHQIALAYWLASYYGVSLGQAIFTIVPHLNRKLL